LLRFLYVYVVQGGFLDGTRGYYFARLHALYEFLSVAKAAELRSQRITPAKPPVENSAAVRAKSLESRPPV
jgi:hypothetical protein